MSVQDYLKRYVWYLDSGCSRHMTWVKQCLHRYLKESSIKVVFGDNSSGDTEGYGSMNCNGIIFTRVAYFNGLKHNLISINQLCDANFKVLFTKTQGTIFNQNNEVVLIAPRRRDVYVIDMSSYNKESNASFLAKASNTGLPSLTFSKDKTFSACEKGKHHRASFKTKRSFSISKCLHLLHMDLFGTVKPQTISLYKYTLVIVDKYSRKMENLNEVRVKKLISDNEIEFRNHKLEEFCDEKGISQNFSSPCTPEQNGVAERKNKTLIEAARTIVKSLDISYFHVFGYHVHIHNHMDHLGKFDAKADDGFSLDDEAISKSSTKGDEINFNENRSFLDDEFIIPRNNVSQYFGNDSYFPYVHVYDPLYTNNITIPDPITPFDPITLTDPITSSKPIIISNKTPKFTIADDHHVVNEHDDSELVEDLEVAKD
ncbi:retrovirus-related pol polyprotein from transposon TNT 1-94 [Tanacetum coccineum]